MSEYIPGMVSVIIPTFKRADKLRRAIDSVLNQTYYKIELLVVNDNEPDDDFSIRLEELISSIEDKRLFLVHQEKHVNGAAARNAGIERAKGEYIAFLDDDDTWIKTKLEKQINTFKKHPKVGLVTTGVYYIYEKEKVTYESIPNAFGDVSKDILISNCVGGTQAMVKKSILDKVGGFDEKLKALQDYELWIRVCQLTEVATVEEPCINYFNNRGTNQVSQVTKNYEISFDHISCKHSNLINDLHLQDKKRRMNATYLLLANKAMRNSDRKTAIKYTTKAFKTKPSAKVAVYGLMSLLDYKYVLKARKKMKI
ncbi:glycosyltransferase family 2 protein [Oceanobacillus polygoni]|uniref:Glycosyltransferase involved in cell wall biosynthesis n=1 Tax=Oceanobacillus polygoni TaxID=1235259 RepID=A0A9X1CE42_9BACI|nr:glycosyltransferase family 2 protein [Oceanobacillus polygoni]MBP2075898.1 glycosyltransferase involved in cell wall biosynthesis [Oceanobacillus polygoni]